MSCFFAFTAQMATDSNVPPPEPLAPLQTPPEPGEVQTTPMPTSVHRH